MIAKYLRNLINSFGRECKCSKPLPHLHPSFGNYPPILGDYDQFLPIEVLEYYLGPHEEWRFMHANKMDDRMRERGWAVYGCDSIYETLIAMQNRTVNRL